MFDFECFLLEILPKNSVFLAVSGVTKLRILLGSSMGNPRQLPSCRLVAGFEQTLTDDVHGMVSIVGLDVKTLYLAFGEKPPMS